MALLPAFVSRNGVMIPPGDASITVFNPAIYGAYGVYESIQVVNGVIFERDAHLQRLAHSAAVIELPLPAELQVIGRWLDEVLAASGGGDCTLRLFLIGPDNGGEPCVYLWAQPQSVYPESYYEQGATAITFEGHRYLPQSKSLNTLTSFMAQRRARAAGVHEALLYHAGCLTEGSNSNLFAVYEGAVITPPEDEVLSGVTRDIVLRLARANSLPLRSRPLPLDEVPAWEECFITSTSRHVMPVTTIDNRPVGSGWPGPVTRRLAALFQKYFEERTWVA
jgi:branched-subunit amino acid aminotransferase/4-amino-4-deoxychorismate lyase